MSDASTLSHPVDSSIVDYIHSLTDMTSTMLVRFGAVIIMSPIFGIPGVLLCIVGVWIGQLYMKTQLAVKRERSNARSPILGHISAAITGLGEQKMPNPWTLLLNRINSVDSGVRCATCVQTRVLWTYRSLHTGYYYLQQSDPVSTLYIWPRRRLT